MFNREQIGAEGVDQAQGCKLRRGGRRRALGCPAINDGLVQMTNPEQGLPPWSRGLNFMNCWWIWSASSLGVGEMTRAWTWTLRLTASWSADFIKRPKMPRMKASVLPDPVGAITIMSLPWSITGVACICTAVGTETIVWISFSFVATAGQPLLGYFVLLLLLFPGDLFNPLQ